MTEYIVKDKLIFLRALAGSGYNLIAPILMKNKIQMALTDPDKVDLDYLNTFLSPKSLFFPQTEKMMAFHKDLTKSDAFVYKPLGLDQVKPSVIFGLRPCDARGLSVIDKIFQNDRFTDPYWNTKYESSVKIGLVCLNPGPNCFCTAVGGSPFGETGLDVITFARNNGFGLKVLSAKGEEFLKNISGLEIGDITDEVSDLKNKVEASLPLPLDLSKVQGATILNVFNQPHWKTTADRCLNCGTCTFVCPTCHCFDIQDEQDEEGGVRIRNWDTCMSWLYTVHGTGHNPRPTKTERMRQRFMHKIKYIPMKQDGICGCIGCGRCVQLCPVNIDIREVVKQMNQG